MREMNKTLSLLPRPPFLSSAQFHTHTHRNTQKQPDSEGWSHGGGVDNSQRASSLSNR